LPGFVALAVAVVAVALSWARLLPLGGSRHSLYLVAVQVAAGASGLAWLAGWAYPPRVPPVERPGHRRTRLLVAGAVAALLLGSVGLRLGTVVRAIGSGAIDSVDGERLIRRRSVETVSRFVSLAPPTLWLTDLQTGMLLLPLAPREGRLLHTEPAFDGRRFDALGRTFALPMTWNLVDAPGETVEHALTWMAGRGGLADGRVGIVTGGWGVNTAWLVARDLRAEGQGAAVLDAAGDERLAAVIVDVRTFRAWRLRRAQGIAAVAPR
jgi:hypothetical protein